MHGIKDSEVFNGGFLCFTLMNCATKYLFFYAGAKQLRWFVH